MGVSSVEVKHQCLVRAQINLELTASTFVSNS